MISELLNIIFLFLYINKINYDEITFFLFYNSVYYYSKIELIYNKINSQINNYLIKITDDYPEINSLLLCFEEFINIENNKNNENNKNTEINMKLEFILNGKIIFTVDKNELLNIENIPTIFDFIIYSEHKKLDNDYIINKKIINKLPVDDDFFMEETNYKFLLCEVIIGDKNIKIDFLINKNNYYIINNTFHISFIKYLLNTYYFKEIKDFSEDEINELRVKILDKNINQFNFENYEILVLNKNGFEVI